MAKVTGAQECCCGADIEWRELPAGIAGLTGVSGYWRHVSTGDIYCYEDDTDALATPDNPGARSKPWRTMTMILDAADAEPLAPAAATPTTRRCR